MELIEQDLSGARILRCDLSNAVLRGVFVMDMEIDTFDLHEAPLWVNGVDVRPYVEEQLAARFPGRELRHATTPDGLRDAWSAAEAAWAALTPAARGHEDVRVADEWSFAETLRHLVFATDTWLHRTVLGVEQPYHPIGVAFSEFAAEGGDTSMLREPSSYDEVLAVRADHQRMVREHLAEITETDLDAVRRNPWAPDHEVTVRSCLHTILNEEWEHLRYATRDLAAIGAVTGPA